MSNTNLNSLIASGVASQTALGLLQANIAKMSFVCALNDMFLITALVTASALLPLFILPAGKKAKKTEKQAANQTVPENI